MSKPTLRIAKKWKWAAKDEGQGDLGTLYTHQPYPDNEEWIPKEMNCGQMFGAIEIPGPWRKSLHKRVGDEWVRVERE